MRKSYNEIHKFYEAMADGFDNEGHDLDWDLEPNPEHGEHEREEILEVFRRNYGKELTDLGIYEAIAELPIEVLAKALDANYGGDKWKTISILDDGIMAD